MDWKELFAEEGSSNGLNVYASDLPNSTVFRDAFNEIAQWWNRLDDMTQSVLNNLNGVPRAVATVGIGRQHEGLLTMIPDGAAFQEGLRNIYRAYSAVQQNLEAEDWETNELLREVDSVN